VRIAIIGGTRFIGPHLVRALARDGHDLVVVHRGRHTAALPAGVRRICHPDAGMPVVRFPGELMEFGADVVIHMVPVGQADARAAVRAFRGRAARLVVLSSGDVYRAYGRLTGLEPGPVEPMPLTESSPLRSVLFPYRAKAASPDDPGFLYEKILVEREVLADPALPATVLRLAKVYGPGDNDDLATVRRFAAHPHWRWTHVYVENVAAAIALAVVHPNAAGRVYNVGEPETPSVRERLAHLPAAAPATSSGEQLNVDQDLVLDSGRIRTELGFREPVPYMEGLRRTLAAA
jgi:nucleoside-diphosphate-sugar epimerase